MYAYIHTYVMPWKIEVDYRTMIAATCVMQLNDRPMQAHTCMHALTYIFQNAYLTNMQCYFIITYSK